MYFWIEIHAPRIPTVVAIIISVEKMSFHKYKNIWPPGRKFISLNTKINTRIPVKQAVSPSNAPSTRKGIVMKFVFAPTMRAMNISFFLEKITILNVFIISKIPPAKNRIDRYKPALSTDFRICISLFVKAVKSFSPTVSQSATTAS